jgi:cytochrome c-type biogenesis protein
MLPSGYVVAMGVAAVFNPCGVALLPASLAWMTGSVSLSGHISRRVGQGALAGLFLAVGFTAVVAVLAVALQGLGIVLAPVLRTAMLALGAALALAGIGVGLGVVHLPLDRWTGLNRAQGLGGTWTLLLAGLVYGVAALSCTLPLFIAALTPAMGRGWMASVTVVGLFGTGAGLTFVGLSEATVFFRDGLQRGLVRLQRWLPTGLGAIVAGAGLYLVYYWAWGPGHLVH